LGGGALSHINAVAVVGVDPDVSYRGEASATAHSPPSRGGRWREIKRGRRTEPTEVVWPQTQSKIWRTNANPNSVNNNDTVNNVYSNQ
jgi:hypothetical protein